MSAPEAAVAPIDAMLAAELALGVLDVASQARAEDLAASDDAFAAAAVAWAHRLHPLTETVAPVAPSPDLWARIERLVAPSAPEREHPAASEPPPPKPVEPTHSPEPERLRRPRSLAIWRASAFGAFAVAAASLVATGVEHERKVAWAPLLAAKLMPAAGTPALLSPAPLFAATVDRTRGVVVLTALSPGPVDPRDRELWLTPKGGPPVPLGVIGGADTRVIRAPPAVLKATAAGAALAVSLEPKGGSRSGRPTGPVIAIGALGRI